MSKSKLREAEVGDIRGMVNLTIKLMESEELFGLDLIEDKEIRRFIITESIAKALASPSYKALVVEKSGRILGVFIGYIDFASKLFRHQTVCNFWIGFQKKSDINVRTILREMMEWAKEKGCDGFKITVLNKNERVKKLLNSLKYDPKYVIYEKEVSP